MGEFQGVSALPLLADAAWGTAATDTGTYRLAYDLALLNVGASTLLAVACVPLWALYVNRISLDRVLKGV